MGEAEEPDQQASHLELYVLEGTSQSDGVGITEAAKPQASLEEETSWAHIMAEPCRGLGLEYSQQNKEVQRSERGKSAKCSSISRMGCRLWGLVPPATSWSVFYAPHAPPHPPPATPHSPLQPCPEQVEQPSCSVLPFPAAQTRPRRHLLLPTGNTASPLGSATPNWLQMARECRGEKAQGSAQGGDQCSPSSSYKDRSGAQEKEQREGLA